MMNTDHAIRVKRKVEISEGPMDQKTATTNTSQQILDIAQRLVQTRGFNAFSYADIASAMGISKASLHYHFVSKSELGVKLIERYKTEFAATLDEIDAESANAAEKLKRYVNIYTEVLADDRMCLCGMLTAEFVTLSKSMQLALDAYFDLNERWLARVLESGLADRSLRFEGSANDASQYIVGSLEGSMMMARPHGGLARFHAATRHLLADFGI